MFFSRMILRELQATSCASSGVRDFGDFHRQKGFLIKAFKRIRSFDDVKVFGISQKNPSSPIFKIRAGNGYQVFEM